MAMSDGGTGQRLLLCPCGGGDVHAPSSITRWRARSDRLTNSLMRHAVNNARIVGTRVEIVSSLAASQAECRRFDPDRPLHSLHLEP